MENRKQFMIRVISLAAVFLLVAGVMSARLFDLQIVNGSAYLEKSDRSLLANFPVKAARGEMLDRYGRPLVTNKQVFEVHFEYAYWNKTEQNRVIHDLCEMLNEDGCEHADTLPISKTAPFVYIGSADDSDRVKLEGYIDEQSKLDKGLGAAELLDQMAALYGVDESYTQTEKREIVGVRYEMARRGFSAYNTFTFASDIPIKAVSQIKERHPDFPGVAIESAYVREYDTDSAANIIGRVGIIYKEDYEEYKEKGYPMDAQVGKDGLEKALEDILRGVSGTRTVETSLSGKVVNEISSVDPQPGKNCILTIDIGLQAEAERSLAENIERIKREGEAGRKNGSKDIEGGAVVVMSVNTGEVLALANYPTYSLKTFNADYGTLKEDPLAPFFNRAIAGRYPPGSTFKMVTALAALEENIVEPNTKINDSGPYMYYAPDYTPACWYYNDYGIGHGPLNVSGALKNSCNYFFYETGRLLGIQRLNKYATMLGLGRKSGIELGGEWEGILAGPEYREKTGGEPWQDGETIQAAIGQTEQSFTPLQLAAYVATLVNGGTYYRPHLLKAVQSYDYSETLYVNEPEAVSSIDIAPENYTAIMEGMRSVTEDGTASTVFRNFDISVGGKTGSAQTRKDRSANGVFVAFAPFENPEIAICVVGEHAGSGNQMAWVARDLISYYFSENSSMSDVEKELTLTH